MNKLLVTLSIGVVFLASCQQKNTIAQKEDILKTNLDTTVNPATDFFEYAEGGWIKRTPIPNDRSSWGIGALVKEELYSRIKHINEMAVAKTGATGVDQQIGDFWFSAMDTNSIEKNGIAPLKGELDSIKAIAKAADLVHAAAHLHLIGVNVFFDEGVGQDMKQSDVMAYYMGQGGLGLPDRDFYFKTDSITTTIRNEYPKFIASLLKLSGYDSATVNAKAEAIVAFETKLAKASRLRQDLRDPYKNYNKYAEKDLNKLTSNFDWLTFLNQVGVQHIDSVIVGQPEFCTELNKLLVSEKLETLKDYMTFHLVRKYSPYLSSAFIAANFNFSKKLSGAKELTVRWKRVLDAEESMIGEPLGQLFVKEYFNEKAKKRYTDMVDGVIAAYKVRIDKLDWMSDSTKKKAQVKLASIKKKVGYPEKWKDLSSLKIDRGPYALNMLRGNVWWNNYSLNKLGKPVDRNEWDMTPQTYNAYYNPSNNEIVLPAGQFTVPGYKDEELDDALVYGYAVASTIGHEITHGFDDEGRQFDEKGNLKSWWSPEDEKQFNERAEKLVKQFNNIVAVDTIHLNGKVSLGENLADLGGVLLGLDAFKQTETYKKGEKINNMTPVQRFFLGYALGWMYQQRKEQMVTQLLSDVHCPPKYRVNGPLPNVPEFYDAFNIKPTDKMYLADSLRVKLW